MNKLTYFIILLIFLVGAFTLQNKFKLKLFSNRKNMLIYFIFIFSVGVMWDYLSVSQHIWIFPGSGIIGLRLGILPIEEYLFFLIVPYFGLTVYKLVEKWK